MIRTLLGTAAALAAISSAHAESVTVQLGGKTGGTIRAELWKAAAWACSSEADPYREPETYGACMSDAYARGLQQAQHFDPDAFRTDAAPGQTASR